MPIVLGLAAALWMLLVLAVIGAVLVGAAVASLIGHMLRGLDDQAEPYFREPTPLDAMEADSTFDDFNDVDDRVAHYSSNPHPGEVTAWWWSPEGAAPELVIDTGRRPAASAVADEPRTPKKQIWTIHLDHSAHYQDEAGDCAWCRSVAAA